MPTPSLKSSSKNVIDAAEGGSIVGKTTEKTLHLLNEISKNAIQWPSDRRVIKKTAISNSAKHPEFQWSNPNSAENSQIFQKLQVQNPPGYSNQNRGQPNFRPYQQTTLYQEMPQQAHPSVDDLLYNKTSSSPKKMKLFYSGGRWKEDGLQMGL
ncbi:hypothetical protein HAX54_039472 [Datura stramonium]|uniref:Uncharacterized protein n=1 Tax=Datura stramonium TaxID=4076 RepID=A0ABS8SIZ2_DATST|nr:hypothetical protein [Datura stramonium]